MQSNMCFLAKFSYTYDVVFLQHIKILFLNVKRTMNTCQIQHLRSTHTSVFTLLSYVATIRKLKAFLGIKTTM